MEFRTLSIDIHVFSRVYDVSHTQYWHSFIQLWVWSFAHSVLTFMYSVACMMFLTLSIDILLFSRVYEVFAHGYKL